MCLTYPSSNQGVRWASSNPLVATVDANGIVRAVSAGQTTITVITDDGDKTASCVVNVPIPVTGVTLNQSSKIMPITSTFQLSATVAPSNAGDKSLRWASSNPSIASVDANGLVTANGTGQAFITVYTNDGNFNASCTVEVYRPVTGI